MNKINTFNITQVSEASGVSIGTIHIHTDRGAIPAPSIKVGRRFHYSQSEKNLIVGYFAGRDRYTAIGVYE